MKSDTIK